nr:reverse transcriptase domain-containing protein [Tanacetum cinerariifolium]
MNHFMRHGKDIKISFVHQDSLNAAVGGNLLEKSPQDALTIIENKSKVRNSRSKPIASPVNACDNHSSSELAKLAHAVNQQTSADFSRDDVLFSPNNEDKVFNPGILSHDKSVKIITHVTQEKKLAVSYASWLSKDFDPPISELLVFKEVPNSMRLLPFSSENEEKVFKPGIYTLKKFQCCSLSDLSHPGFHVFKVNLIFLSLMKIFHVQNGKNTPPLDVLLFHFYPP